MIRKAFSKLLPLAGVFLLAMVMLTCFKSTSLAQSISLESVSILPDDRILIKYDHTGGDITFIEVRYIADLENLIDHTDIPVEAPFTGEIIIENPSAPGHSDALNFLLRGEIEGIPVPATDYHSTIFLEEIESVSVSCELAVHARWMNYAIFPRLDAPFGELPFDFLQILISEYDQSAGMCEIDTERIIYQDVQSYWDDEVVIELPDDITPGSELYCFRVRSYDSSDPSGPYEAYSNMITGVQISDLETPDKVELVSVDVIDNEYIEVRLEVDDFGFGQFEYSLFRSDNRTTGFSRVSPPLEHNSQNLTFSDESLPSLEDNPWYYYVMADIKDCPGLHTKYSGTSSSIFLKAEVADGFDPESSDFVEINLSWEHDPAWDDYILKRRLQGGAWENVPDFDYSAGDFSFIDELALAADEITVDYLLEADKAGPAYSIHSNMVTVELGSEVVYVNPISVPHNALRPGSDFEDNRVFLPEQFDDPPITYNLSIFDRNGLLVFSTGDHQLAWDGTINGPGGIDAPAGAYIYHITITDLNDDRHEKKGVVYLVR